MDPTHQNVLMQVKYNIIDDVDVNNGIIAPLLSEYILREEDVDNINKGETKQKKAQILLDILPQRGQMAFEIFYQSLKHQYWWINEEIDNLLKSTTTSDTNNDVLLTYPNLQPVSPLTVTRESMITQLKDALWNVKPNGYVALHGMKGFGKSCLTASTLKDKDLILKNFNNEIYWIKFGYSRFVNEEVVIQLNNLYHQIKHLNSTLELTSSEPLEKVLCQTIKNHFTQPIHRNALLILDDVNDKEVVEKFDFNCKTLVITSDIGVLQKRSHVVVKMDHGFTENETLGLFAKVIDVDIKELPLEAKLIHEECKGMPLLIAMFAAQFENFKHDMKHHRGRWEYYLNCLKTKNAKNKVIEEFMKIQEATFEMCINQLENDMRERYENLAIFSEDVNIMPKTLEILWSEEPYCVEDQMLDFCHKSLAAKKWNDDLKSYVYGVHDLLLCHLKAKSTPIQIRDKHRLFIKKCRDYCNGDFSKLPDDNYTFSYIGHHFEQAELYEEFNKWYMNFDFLQTKINYTGLSDLFIDLKKYRKYITKNGDKTIESNLIDLENFLENHANTLAKHRLIKCLDLVQIALDHSSDGFVANTAKILARSRSLFLYLFHQKNSTINPYSDFCEEITTNASCVAFTNVPSHILVGSHDGKVILWNCENRQGKVFSGHEKCAIKKIIVSWSGSYFLAVGENGILKLFALSDIDCESDRYSLPDQSPRYKQTYWTELFEYKNDCSLKTYYIKSELITDMKFGRQNNKILACTNSGTVKLWDFDGNSRWHNNYKNHRFGGVCFTSDDNLIHVIDETISVIRIYTKQSDHDYKYVSQYNLQLNNPKVIYFSKHPEENNCLIVVTDKVSLYFKWFTSNSEHIHSYDKIIKTEEKEKNTTYVAATLTYDSRYLIIGNSNGIISVMKAYNPDHFITFFKGNVTSLDSYWMNNENFHLICGSEKRWIHRWKVRDDEKPNSVKEILFDAKIGESNRNYVIVLKTAPKVLTLYDESKKITIESSYGPITSIKLDENADKLFYVTESGFVIMYDINDGKSTQLSRLESVDIFVGVLRLKDNFLVLSNDENNRMKTWRNVKISNVIMGAEHVIFFHKLNDDSIITISKNGTIKCWLVEDFAWQAIYEFRDRDSAIIYTCLSHHLNYLALLTDNNDVMVYKLLNSDQTNVFQVQSYLKHSYKQQLSICDFSQDEQYLAVALDNGLISVIELETLLELSRLSLHRKEVCQLFWSPITIGAPILLSVGCDELAWWNVAYLKSDKNDKNQNRRNRMGIFSRSASSLAVGCSNTVGVSDHRTSCRMSSSLSMVTSLADTVRPANLTISSISNINDYWMRKLPKNDAQRPGFLGCVQLPSCTNKIIVCVSADFSQFLVADIHGTITNYTLFID